MTYNNIYNFSNEGLRTATPSYPPPAPFEASYNNTGNYWGHNTCPLFTPGIDSFDDAQMDSHPYNQSNAWDLNISPKICCGRKLNASHTLTEDLQTNGSYCFNITASNVVLDCAGYNNIGTPVWSAKAIYAYAPASNITIKNCNILNWGTGIDFTANNIIIENNNLSVNKSRVRAAVEDLAMSYENPEQVVNWYYSNHDQLSQVENMVLEEQVVDAVFESSRTGQVVKVAQ